MVMGPGAGESFGKRASFPVRAQEFAISMASPVSEVTFTKGAYCPASASAQSRPTVSSQG